jgi:hypothetical protein
MRDDGLRYPVDWDAVKHDFIHGDWSIDRIAEAHGASRTTISKRAKREVWERLVGTKRLRPGPRLRPAGAPRPTRDALEHRRRAQLLRRLFRALEARLTEIEKRMAKAEADGTASAADAERDMRSLSAITSVYAKAIELEEQMRKSQAGKGSNTDASGRSEDADHLRRDLALRLDRLSQAQDA